MRWKARTPVLQSQTVWREESIVYRSTASSCRQLNCQVGARTGRRWGRQPPGWGRLRRCRCRLARPGRTHRRRWPPLLRWQGTPRYVQLPPAPKATNTHFIQAAESESCPLYFFWLYFLAHLVLARIQGICTELQAGAVKSITDCLTCQNKQEPMNKFLISVTFKR